MQQVPGLLSPTCWYATGVGREGFSRPDRYGTGVPREIAAGLTAVFLGFCT
jgi:hypothetical protein